jgi:hypothetical protein
MRSYFAFYDIDVIPSKFRRKVNDILNIEAKLSEKEKEIETVRQRDNHNADAISSLSDMLLEMRKKIEALEIQQKQQ